MQFVLSGTTFTRSIISARFREVIFWNTFSINLSIRFSFIQRSNFPSEISDMASTGRG